MSFKQLQISGEISLGLSLRATPSSHLSGFFDFVVIKAMSVNLKQRQ